MPPALKALFVVLLVCMVPSTTGSASAATGDARDVATGRRASVHEQGPASTAPVAVLQACQGPYDDHEEENEHGGRPKLGAPFESGFDTADLGRVAHLSAPLDPPPPRSLFLVHGRLTC